MKNYFLSIACCAATLCSASNKSLPLRILPGAIYASGGLKNIELYHTKQGFIIRDDLFKSHKIENAWIDASLRSLSPAQIIKFIDAGGRFSIGKISPKEYMIRGYIPGIGGGPIAGTIAYWAVKGGAYGGMLLYVYWKGPDGLSDINDMGNINEREATIEIAAENARQIGSAIPWLP